MRSPAPSTRPLGATPTPTETPIALLGGLSPQAFMRRHWQKKPLLVRQALPGVAPLASRRELFALAQAEGVESRLIERPAGDQADGWRLRQGPLAKRALPPVSKPGWTLLVQGLDLHLDAAHALLQRFRFVPEARLDDLMVSWASDGGGVGPHVDSYDVFLLQLEGRRRWRIGPLQDDGLRPGLPLKILARFEPTQEWLLEPGDMLYLPPGWAHDGVADGACMTASIGFRAPQRDGLARELLVRMAEHEDERALALYRDPAQPATATPGAMPAELLRFATDAVARRLKDPQALALALGEVLSEPKPNVWFEPGEPIEPGRGVRLDRRTRMLYDAQHVYVNGESWRAGGADARLMRRLADHRQLTPREVDGAGAEALGLLQQWADDGWLRAWGDEHDA